jgi:small-conductance mechanosensitive channel
LLAFTIIPFLSFSPPAVYIELCWFAMLIVATRLAWPDWSAAYHKYWRVVIVLFFLFGLDNIITRITPGERWFILILSGLAVYVGWKLIQEVRREPKAYPSFQKEVIWLFVGANTASFLLNIFGRFTLAKVISNSAVIGLAHALSFFLLVEILIEALYLLLEGNGQNKLSSYLQFSALKVRFRKILIFIGVVLWLLAFLWSLNLLDSTTDLISGFLQKDRMIGTMEFTLGSIAVFIFVFWCSFSLSNLLRFFFGGNQGNQINSAAKSKMGSWILLVRLVIISVGFLLAMGAAGIPLDKLAIIIGALGVGIGFGLQNIVNNLVSGIILAFEKPMDVGDVIEIGVNTGRVKEIGIRSSKISTFDGADIIVPNGDFISQRLTNWTHNNTYRRIELIVGVAYGTDLDKAQQVVQQLLDGNTEIENQPAPNIFWNEMGNSAVNMRILFWTSDFDNWVALKSKVLKGIYQEFYKAGISIPFPQQDLHLKSIDPELIRQFILKGEAE